MSAKQLAKDNREALAAEMLNDIVIDIKPGAEDAVCTHDTKSFFSKYLSKADALLNVGVEDHVPVTEAMVDNINNVRNLIIPAQGKAVGQAAAKAFADNPELKTVTMQTPWGTSSIGRGDHIQSMVERSVEFKVAGNTSSHNLNLSTKFVCKGSKNSGALGDVVAELRAYGKEAF